MTVPPEIPLWAYAAAGAFGGLAIELISILGAIQRCKKVPWRQEGEVGPGALVASIIIRLVLGIGVALALGQSGEIAGLIAAVGAGAGAPLILEQLAKQVAGQIAVPEQSSPPAAVVPASVGAPGYSSALPSQTVPSPQYEDVNPKRTRDNIDQLVLVARLAYNLSMGERSALRSMLRHIERNGTRKASYRDVKILVDGIRSKDVLRQEVGIETLPTPWSPSGPCESPSLENNNAVGPPDDDDDESEDFKDDKVDVDTRDVARPGTWVGAHIGPPEIVTAGVPRLPARVEAGTDSATDESRYWTEGSPPPVVAASIDQSRDPVGEPEQPISRSNFQEFVVAVARSTTAFSGSR